MARILYRSVLLALVVGLFAAAPALAVQRYASPTGIGPATSCLAIDPCNIVDAVDSSHTVNGDEVILAPGDYTPTELDVTDAVDVHGQGSPSQTRIFSTASTAVYLDNAGAKLRNVEIDHSTGSIAAVFAVNGTVEHVIARSDSGSACVVFNTTIRDSICASSSSGDAGVSLNINGSTYSTVLRNVTAIGSGATNSFGIIARAEVATTVSIDAKSVIARGTTYDVLASTSGTSSSTVTLDHSNYESVSTVGAAVTVTATSANSNQTAAPVFVNAAAGDYHQAAGSPTIDAGAVDGSSGTTDIDGDARVLGLFADIGADEFDSTAPAAPSITSPTSGSFTADTTPTVSGSAEANRTIAVFANGNPVGTTSADGLGNWSLNVSALAEGAFAITATAANVNAVTSSASSAVSLTVDVTAPSVSITAPANGSLTADNTPQVTFSITEANPSTSECRLDGGAWLACASNDSLAALADGSHTLAVRHTDAAGNVGASSTTFTLDTTAPSVSITAPANGSLTGDNTPQVTFSITEANPSTSECRLDSGAWLACASNDSLAALADGSHTLAVRHTDAVGNVGASSTTFTVDTTAPQTKIRKHPKRRTRVRKARFTFSSSEAKSTFKCKLDKRRFAPCKSPFVKRVKPGRHKLQIVAIDAAGNADRTPAIYKWTLLAG